MSSKKPTPIVGDDDESDVAFGEDGQPLSDWDLPWTPPENFLYEHMTPTTKLATGFPSLDRALGGGIPLGRLLTLQGAPHAGKTTLAVQMAMRSVNGSAADAYFLMPDEGARGACTRMGQGWGLARAKVAEWDDETAFRFMQKVYGTKSRIRVIDPDLEIVTLERVLESIRRRQIGQERPTVIVMDSTQTLQVASEHDAERLRIGEVMAQLRKATRRWDCVIINVSHVNRAAYRHKRQEDNINPLAGGAESAAIERQSDIVVHLDGDVKAIVTARCVKNREHEGDKPFWQMKLDSFTAQFTELDEIAAADAAQAEREAEHDREMGDIQQKALKILAKKADWISSTKLYQEIGGRKASCLEALARLADSGQAEVTDGPRNSTLYRKVKT